MSVKPILFSGPMVRALLDERKTQTRRVLKPQPVVPHGLYFQPMHGTLRDGAPYGDRYTWRIVGPDYPDDHRDDVQIGYGVGDLLWVRETWRSHGDDGGLLRDQEHSTCTGPHDVMFQATCDEVERGQFKFRPSIFMPRWANRITLEVTEVRVQRLQDISPKDAIEEGVDLLGDPNGFRDYSSSDETARLAMIPSFRTLWDSLNSKRGFGWDANPWVAAYTFNLHKQNIDELLKERAA